MEHLHWLVPLILVALLFDFLNGFHDAANSIATVVATRVLSPQFAVLWAAFFNLIGPLFFGEHVAKTIGKGIIDIQIVTPTLVLAALSGAIAWNIITWYYGLPSSSSHALIGGLVGAGFYVGGFDVMLWEGIGRVVVFIFLSPLIGFVLGGAIFTLLSWVCCRKNSRWSVIMVGCLLGAFAFGGAVWLIPYNKFYKFLAGGGFAVLIFLGVIWVSRCKTLYKLDQTFRKLQLLSSALYSIGHGTNDAQKTMGIIFMLLVTGNFLKETDSIPFWVLIVCSMAIALGTACGGWRIVRTMGSRITRLTPYGGFCAEAAGATALFAASSFGIPVSTTHTITGSIIGVGSTLRYSAVRWRLARRVVWAWVFTIPAAALIAIATQSIIHLVAGH